MAEPPDMAGGAATASEALLSEELGDCVEIGKTEALEKILAVVGWSKVEMIRCWSFLLRDGAGHFIEDKGTLLHLACRYSQPEVVKLLLEGMDSCDLHLGVDQTSTHFFFTPLHLSAMYGDEGSCKHLLAFGANVDATHGRMPLMTATPLLTAVTFGKEEVVQLLLEHGAKPNLATPNGINPLHVSSRRGNDAMVQLLVDHGADINRQQHLHLPTKSGGPTALHMACEAGHASTVQLLLKLGAVAAVKDDAGRTALDLAKCNEQWEVVFILSGEISAAASVVDMITHVLPSVSKSTCLPRNMSNSAYRPQDALSIALKAGSLQLAMMACQVGALLLVSNDKLKEDVLKLALKKGSVDLAEMACQAGAASVSTNLTKVQVLYLSLKKGAADLAELACQAGAASLSTDSMKRDLLMMALTADSVGLAKAAYHAGAMSPSTDFVKKGVVKLALRTGSVDLAEMACRNGSAFVLTKTVKQDLLEWAVDVGSVDLACTLADQGLELEPILDLALKKGAVEAQLNDPLAGQVQEQGIGQSQSVQLIMAVVASNPQAIGSLTQETFNSTLSIVLREASVEFAKHACEATSLFLGCPDHLQQALLDLALEKSSLPLVTAAIRSGAFNKMDDWTLKRLLLFALHSRSAQLAAFALKAGALAVADQDTLDRALQLGIAERLNDLLSILAEAGVLSRSTSAVKEEVLHEAIRSGDRQLVDLCISSGALQNADQWASPTPIQVAEYYGFSRLSAHLRRALDYQRLIALRGEKDADTVLLRVAGPPGAGKSTLV